MARHAQMRRIRIHRRHEGNDRDGLLRQTTSSFSCAYGALSSQDFGGHVALRSSVVDVFRVQDLGRLTVLQIGHAGVGTLLHHPSSRKTTCSRLRAS